jgi:hypothetical protein
MTFFENDADYDSFISRHEAGDISPTSPQSVRTAFDQENSNWLNLNDAVIASLASGKIGTDFSFPFTTDYYTWKTFYTITLQSTPFGWEPMTQLDEWRTKRAVWAQQLEKRIGIQLPGLLDAAPPRNPPDSFPGFTTGFATAMVPLLLGAGAIWYFILSKKS